MGKIYTILGLILLFLMIPITVSAQNFRSGQTTVLQKNEVINKDYFATGNTVSVEGTVNGDAYLAGGNIIVDGTVNGDLLAAGGNIDIRGTVTGNIRSAGGNINISGVVGRNVSLAGGNINVSGGNITGNLTLAGGQVAVGSKVSGDVNTAAGQLSLTQNAVVGGDLNYLSKNSALVAEGAQISGKTTQNIPPQQKPKEQIKRGTGFFLGFFTIADFILTLIIGILLLKLLPKYFGRISAVVAEKPWASLGIGLLTVIVFPVVFILMCITLIGIPVAIVLTVALGVDLYISKIFVSFVIGRYVLNLFKKESGNIWTFLAGLVVFSILALIPIFGWLFSTAVCLIGLGAILIQKRAYYKELRLKQII